MRGYGILERENIKLGSLVKKSTGRRSSARNGEPGRNLAASADSNTMNSVSSGFGHISGGTDLPVFSKVL